MGACSSFDLSASPKDKKLAAIKKEKKLLLIGLSAAFERDFICRLQSILCDTDCYYFVSSKYEYGPLKISETTPNHLVLNAMKNVSDSTYSKLLRHWKLTDYDCLLQGWFRQNCHAQCFPDDLIKYMKIFICIPSIEIDSYKMHSAQRKSHKLNVLNLWNVSSIYRKCWSLKNNKECFRHKELSYCFENAALSIFIVDLSCYDELCEQTGGNKMNRTIKLYQWFLKDYSLYLKKHGINNGNVILLLDKIDKFKLKLINKSVSLTQCSSFKKYDGPPFDVSACQQFIMSKFVALNLYSAIKLDVFFDPKYVQKIQQL